jgi:hypothetical protein
MGYNDLSYARSRGLGVLDDEDELERRRRADELASLAPSSPDAWIDQQANRNPTWMRRQPDMSIGTFEAQDAPDMTIGLDEAERRPDMTFTEQETDTAPNPSFSPDMTFSLEESRRNSALADDELWDRSLRTPGYGAPPSSQQSTPLAAASDERTGGPQPQLSALLGQGPGNLDQRWLDAEGAALDRSGYGGGDEYGIGEGIRDFAPMAIGGALDILINKGKGLGALTAGGMQAISHENVRRDRSKQAAADDALAMKRQREAGGDPSLERAYKLAQMERWAKQGELGGENLEQRQLNTMMNQAKLAYQQDPNNPQAIAMVAKVKELTGVDLAGLGNQAAGRVMPIVGREQGANLAGPMQDARNRSDLAFAGPTATAKEIGSARGELEAAPTQLAANTALGKVPEREVRDETFTTQFAKDNEAPIKVGLALQAIMSKSQDGQPAPGLDPVSRLGSKVPGATQLFPETFTQDVQEVLQNLDLAEEAYSRDQSGAAIGVKEAAKFLRQVIGSPLAKAEDVQAAIGRFAQRNNEYLSARAAANPKAAGSVFEAAGLNIGGAPKPPPAAGGGSRANYGPDAGHPSNLGNTGDGRRPPPIPPLAPPDPRGGEGKPQAIKRPDGAYDIDGETYTEDEVQRLMRKGLIQ